MKALACLAMAAALTGCATDAFRPSEVGAAGMPYDGLNENSYGPRSTLQFRYCDPQDEQANTPNLSPDGRARVAEFASNVATGVGSVVGKPLQGMTKVDRTLASLGLADRFRVASDSSHPLVAVLSHAEDSIVFWHSAKYVRPREVTAAAQAYCAKRQRPVLYRGSASRCPAVERGLAGQPIVNTYAISAYACPSR
ncbi:MAG: hypothetical protein KF788_02590 [Piscinibacter sp.]|nr:hypothetical protein [Piscinibacter sp.]